MTNNTQTLPMGLSCLFSLPFDAFGGPVLLSVAIKSFLLLRPSKDKIQFNLLQSPTSSLATAVLSSSKQVQAITESKSLEIIFGFQILTFTAEKRRNHAFQVP